MPARPVRLVDPFIQLGGPTTPPPVDFTCFIAGIHLTGEADDDLATFCDPNGFAYTLLLDGKMSLGADGLEEALNSLGGPGTVVPFEFAYTKDAASVDNPHWSGKVRIPAYNIVDAGINEASDVPLEMPVIGDVEKSTGGAATMVVGQQAHQNAHASDPLNQSSTVFGSDAVPADLAALKADTKHGDTHYSGTAFTTGQYVMLGDGSRAHVTGTGASSAWATGVSP